jgi:trimethylamine--corrinoid protein Co-methyltransferase
MAALSGWDFIYDAAGSLESSLTASYAKMVLDNDVCGEVKRIISGIDMTEEALAVDVIRIAAAKGGFLSSPHTLRHFRKETYSPSSFWRGSRTHWESQGRKDILTRARETAEQVIREHRISVPLDPEVDREMMDYIKKVKKRTGV